MIVIKMAPEDITISCETKTAPCGSCNLYRRESFVCGKAGERIYSAVVAQCEAEAWKEDQYSPCPHDNIGVNICRCSAIISVTGASRLKMP